MNEFVLMCNMAWMKNYDGISADDFPINGGKFIDENGHGHEVLNFRRHGKYVYGYVQAKNHTINVDRIGAEGADFVDGVTVVWRARSRRGSVVVGWYKNARVYRNAQEPSESRAYSFRGKKHRPGYSIRSLVGDAVLLKPSQRLLRVPVTHKGFGSQTFVSFLEADNPEVHRFKNELKTLMKRVESDQSPAVSNGKRGTIDVEERSAIEKCAILAATSFYEELGYSVQSVEYEKCGFDLHVMNEEEELHVEVKGTKARTHQTAAVLLTPNEFRTSREKRKTYRIVVVADVPAKPKLAEFAWCDKRKRWVCDESLLMLQVAEVVGASLTAVPLGGTPPSSS